MSPRKGAFVIFLAAYAVFNISGAAAQDYWWRRYEASQGLNDALGAYGLSTRQLDQDAEGSLRMSADVGSPLYWIKRTVYTYGQADAGRYRIPIAEDHALGKSRTASSGRMADFFTQTWAKAGEVISVTLLDTPPEHVRCSVQTSPDFGVMAGLRELSPGEKTAYVAPVAGTITLGCRNYDPLYPSFGSSVAIDVQGGTLYPMFIFGLTPFADWKDRLSKSPNPANKVHMFGGRTRIDLPAAKAEAAANMDLGRLFREHLGMTLAYDRLNGLDATGGPLNYPSQGLINATYGGCCNSDGGQGKIKIGFAGKPQNPTSWGEWHEYGHQYQMQWSWQGLSEVTVNLYSISACRPLRGAVPMKDCDESKFFVELGWGPNTVEKFIREESQKQFDGGSGMGVVEKATLFAGLAFSYPDLFPQLGREFRKQWDYGKNAAQFDTYQKKKDWFVVNASRFAKRDLTPFFKKWGLFFTPVAKAEIHAMRLPAPATEYTITHATLATQAANASIEDVISFAGAADVGLVAYSTAEGPIDLLPDGPVDGYTTLKVAVHDEQLHPATLVLRATARHDREWHAMNVTRAYAGGTLLRWRLDYRFADNVFLPPGRYKGEINLGLRSALPEDAFLGKVLKIAVDVTR